MNDFTREELEEICEIARHCCKQGVDTRHNLTYDVQQKAGRMLENYESMEKYEYAEEAVTYFIDNFDLQDNLKLLHYGLKLSKYTKGSPLSLDGLVICIHKAAQEQVATLKLGSLCCD